MSDKMKDFENAILALQKKCVLDGRHVNSDNELEMKKEEVRLSKDSKVICEVVLSISEVLRHNLIEGVSNNDLWNQAQNLLPNRFSFQFIKQKCPFIQIDSQKMFLWILLEVSQKTLDNLLDHIQQTEFFNLYKEDSCIKDKFLRLIELSRILQSISFMIDGKLLFFYDQFINQQTIKESALKSSTELDSKLNTSKPILLVQPSNRFENQGPNQFRPFLYKNVSSVLELAQEKSSLMNNRLAIRRDSLKLQSRNSNTSNKQIDLTMSPIPRLIEESDEESKPKMNKETHPQIFLNFPDERGSQTTPLSIGLIRNSEMNAIFKEEERKQERVRPSQKLFQVKFSNIKEHFSPKSLLARTIKSQGFKCLECSTNISRGLYIIGTYLKYFQIQQSNAHYCNYSSGWVCSDCIAQEKRPIWWNALEKFDLTGYKVSKSSKKEIDSLYQKPILQLEYDAEVVTKHQILYDFLLLKRQVHLLYDVICFPEYLETQLKENMNLCLKQNILSLKNLYDINNGSLIRLLVDILRIYRQHVQGCDKCFKIGKTCGICNSTEKIYVFDIKNTILCERCNELFHRNCLVDSECEKCQREG